MYRIEWKNEILTILFLIAMLLSPAFLYSHLPADLPIHWNIHGKVDRYVAKTLITVWMFPLLTAGMYLLMLFVPFVDPKREKYEKFKKAYGTIRLSLVGFMGVLYVYITSYSLGYELPADKVIPALVSVLFIILGNTMGKIRQNFFVGFKFPWTISNEDVWNKTHRVGGKLMVLSGVIGLIGLLLPSIWTFCLLLGSLFSGIIATAIYSYILYKRNLIK